jgi:hypothetical protein
MGGQGLETALQHLNVGVPLVPQGDAGCNGPLTALAADDEGSEVTDSSTSYA